MSIDEAWARCEANLPPGGGITKDKWYIDTVSYKRDWGWTAKAVRTCIPVWNYGKRVDWNYVVGIGKTEEEALNNLADKLNIFEDD